MRDLWNFIITVIKYFCTGIIFIYSVLVSAVQYIICVLNIALESTMFVHRYMNGVLHVQMSKPIWQKKKNVLLLLGDGYVIL